MSFNNNLLVSVNVCKYKGKICFIVQFATYQVYLDIVLFHYFFILTYKMYEFVLNKIKICYLYVILYELFLD